MDSEIVWPTGCMSGLGFELQTIENPMSKCLLFSKELPFWPGKLHVHAASEELTDKTT